jgi:hypothetical protein
MSDFPVKQEGACRVRRSPSRRPLVALLAAELVCVTAWALTGSFWWVLGALMVGVVLVVIVLFSDG